MSAGQKVMDEVVEDIFKEFDKDNSGYLETSEFAAFVSATIEALGEPCPTSPDSMKEVMEEMDSSGDGKIAKDELKDFVKKVAGI